MAVVLSLVSIIGTGGLVAEEQWETLAPVVEWDDESTDSPQDGGGSKRNPAPVVRGRPIWAQAAEKSVKQPSTASPIYGLSNRAGQRLGITGRAVESASDRAAIETRRVNFGAGSTFPTLTRSQYQAAQSAFNTKRLTPAQLTRASKPLALQPSWLRGTSNFFNFPAASKASETAVTPEPPSPSESDSAVEPGAIADSREPRQLSEEIHDLKTLPKSSHDSIKVSVPPVEIDLSTEDEAVVTSYAEFIPVLRCGKFIPDLGGRLHRTNVDTTRIVGGQARLPSAGAKQFALALSKVLTAPRAVTAQPDLRARLPNTPVPIAKNSQGEPAVESIQARRPPAPPEPIAVPQNPAASDATAVADAPMDEEVFKPIRELQANISSGDGDRPSNMAEARFAREGYQPHVTGFSRFNFQTVMNWEASALCHRPLYFEEVNLERHGYQVPILQPVISGAHFFSRLPAVPYLVVSQQQRVCNYTLGHYRPGSPAPYVWYYANFSLDAASVESILITGLMYAIP